MLNPLTTHCTKCSPYQIVLKNVLALLSAPDVMFLIGNLVHLTVSELEIKTGLTDHEDAQSASMQTS